MGVKLWHFYGYTIDNLIEHTISKILIRFVIPFEIELC